ncbi:hypothetical protein [Paenibacillus sedimenti]|uniref:DSBA-like thioredoxin domain-containing protein n=1 Tax=Paenibacillus sedimenti TaxID=2770274 RepID=A0A926KSU5_9BACL|nr:hypothetical protein [Paenibacillus sedimenti]MBD0381539.1 hypothetical protein [Paenibacillus sedimenti]
MNCVLFSVDFFCYFDAQIYYEGMSLSDPGTYHKIALANNIDPNAVLELLDDPAAITAARADIVKVKHLGVNSYPTLLLRNRNELISLGGAMGIEELEERLARTNFIQNTAGEHCSLDNKNGC